MKARSVVFSPEAREDLLILGDWIAERAGPATALRYLARLEAACLGLSTASERGRRRDDIRPGLRVVGFERRITIAFVVSQEQVTILRLHYGGLDWDRKSDPI
ncbi:Plasmid stabilization system protein ParE [Fulvimarina manganoxydans]|uniref:Plasmid stabilization system protein ParE n=1 Tax=Fulvimarina manganoxydans TaxID=937218 RepID=A0A1W2ECD3_9HYPH|nr:type II toxin-antitoxin system RelE/ParE family toxin [Fulvimarina manganoxydans]SMD07052.1 Plasmid stabilization system protein ParE [Fulvimarina manganoxydans]